MIGIYGIYNKAADKWYIGKSVDIEKRWNKHLSLLNKNKHANVHLQRAWNHYGSCAFEWIVLAQCSTNCLNELEQQFISHYDSVIHGYNCTAGGDGALGFHHSESHRQRICGSGNPMYGVHRFGEYAPRYGAVLSDETRTKIMNSNPNKRAVLQYDLNGVFMHEFPSVGAAARSIGKDQPSIKKCCKNKTKTAYGFVWRYRDEVM